jgi:hypothetical protein
MGGEQFPDSELNLKEDYELENEEPLSTTPISLQFFFLATTIVYFLVSNSEFVSKENAYTDSFLCWWDPDLYL